MDPESFKASFIDWVNSFDKDIGRIVAIDGKTLRRSFDTKKDVPAIHIVSAFASEARLVLAQKNLTKNQMKLQQYLTC